MSTYTLAATLDLCSVKSRSEMIVVRPSEQSTSTKMNQSQPTKPTNQPTKTKTRKITKQPTKQPISSTTSKYRNQLLKQNKSTNALWINILLVCPFRTTWKQSIIKTIKYIITKTWLEQLERLRSEDTPRRPMITPYYWPVYFESQVHIIDQLISDPKSKQGESRKISENLKF